MGEGEGDVLREKRGAELGLKALDVLILRRDLLWSVVYAQEWCPLSVSAWLPPKANPFFSYMTLV